ncbi:MAG: 16S rRNA (guanine(966)-N(2))-methyltransferase RsmD [Idiomarina sp.]|nr:16S rRNA (guanine(966)-N(2))-methyltransferase RsmD [Idiomarina sp.]
MKRTPSRQPPKIGTIRIVGGLWRGRKLPVVDAEGLRPTPDRVKETLFNWLQFELADARVADLFAGSGGLGLEALSRGAAHADFIETSAPAVTQLHTNLTSLGARGEVHAQGAEAYLKGRQPRSIDIIFIDPPFAKGWLERIIPMLDEGNLMAINGWVYVECSKRDAFTAWPANWRLHREKKVGQVMSRLFQVGE